MSVSTAPPATTHAVPGQTCPRCHTTEDWGESSWCPGCGYYPVVDGSAAGGASWADGLPELPQEEVADDRTALQSIPGWFWAMMAGIVAITGFSVTIRTMFPEDDGPRGTIALVQLGLGMTSMLVSHLIAGKVAMASDRRINVNDILLSWFNVWQPTIGELPRTCKRIWAMVWGMIAVLTSTTIIGGIDYAAPFRAHKAPDIKPMSMIGTVASAAAAQAKAQGNDGQSLDDALNDIGSQVEDAQGPGGMLGGTAMSMEDSLNELGDSKELAGVVNAAADVGKETGQNESTDEDQGTDEATGADDSEAAGSNQGEADADGMLDMTCVIYGLETDEQNVPVRFLFASRIDGDDLHVADIETKDLPPETFHKIAVRLHKEIRRRPVIASERQAIWVNPVVICRLKYAGYTDEGQFQDPQFDAIVVRQRGVYDKPEDVPSPE